MTFQLPAYQPRKKEPVNTNLKEAIDFLALDWCDFDLPSETTVEKKESYLNQDHNKTYSIFIFGCNAKGESICLRVKNYMPYFYVQIPDNFNEKQIQEFVNNFNSETYEDYEEDELIEYEEALTNKNYKFAEKFKQSARFYRDAVSDPVMEYDKDTKANKYLVTPENKKNLKTQLVEKKIFWTFMNEQKFKFLKIAHKSKQGHKFMEKMFKSPIKLKIDGKINSAIKYNLFESDLEPILRFLHDTKVQPSSWIHLEAGKFKMETRQSKAQINISCDWTDVCPLDKADIPPLLIASFDIEADSSHGDFPIPKKDCKKLSNQLAITWIRDLKIIEKKLYEKFTKNFKNLNLDEKLLYVDIDKKNSDGVTATTHDKTMLALVGDKLKELVEKQNTQNAIPTKEIQYLREVVKYINAKANHTEKQEFFAKRIKQSLDYEQFKGIDSEIDLIYLKRPIKAKVFTNSGDFGAFTNKLYSICNRPIRKVKANNEMKKAVKEVVAIEAAKSKTNHRFGIEDLVKIIIDVAKKHKIPERDLQDKIITKETMVRFINIELNKAFGFAQGDKVIQIGTVFWRYGEADICHNNIITLKGADKFKVGDKDCEVICKTQERDVLIEWSKLIELHDPDIIIGYNTFGFDESFMYDRITDLCLDADRMSLNKEDLKALDANSQYQKFINLGRLDDTIVKRVREAKGGLINKQLSSSALGDNFMYYFNTAGRVQIDLLKVCQASMTKLPSYKLDSVAEFYISGKIKEIVCPEGSGNVESSCKLKVDNIQELEVGNYIVISMATTTAKLYDGEKLKILEIDREAKKIVVDRPVPKSCLTSGPVWGLGKDDITPQDIFRMQKGSNADRAQIAKYCIQDCVLLIRLLRKLEVITNNFGMSNVCLVPFSYIFLRGQSVKGFSLVVNECAKEDFILPVLEKIEPEEVVVDDNTRRKHTIAAAQNQGGGGGIEDEDDRQADIESAEVEDGESENDEEDGEDEDNEFTKPAETTQIKFSLKNNFNQIMMTDESFAGAIVLPPKTDIYLNPIVVMDFSSLYPSEIISSNLSHDSICEDPKLLGESGAKYLASLGYSYIDRTYDNFEWVNPKIKSKGKRKCGSTTVRFVQFPDGKKGLIPRILMTLLKNRKITKKKMEAEKDPYKKAVYDGLQLAYKISSNSIYGCCGAKTSKIYKPEIAAATTAGGRGRIIHARDFVLREYPRSKIAYGDTDSLFIEVYLESKFGEILSDRDKISMAIKLGQEIEEKIKVELPGVHCLSYEKVLCPLILISKKRYIALKFENDCDNFKQISTGVVSRRRDNCVALKHCYLGVIDKIMKDKNVEKAISFIIEEIKKMVDGKYDLSMFTISKCLNSYYKDPDSIAHRVLASRMADRDIGTAPVSNERIPYIFIKIKEEANVEYLQGDRIEHVDYVKKHNLQVDYVKYITNQIMKPVSQIFELIVEKLPQFPYSENYYEEIYNIWYNKYSGDEIKTEKKVRQLKAKMVQKLIFQPLIDYAESKVNKTTTLDQWITSNQEEDIIEKKEKAEKPKHEIKVKKSKQMSLDSFF